MKRAEKGRPEERGIPNYKKKKYATPRLINHGDVEHITRALGGSGSDGQGGSQVGDEPG